MKPLILTLLGVAMLAGFGLMQYRTLSRLRADNAVLAAASAEAADLKESLSRGERPENLENAREEIARLRDENRDLLKLRNDVRQLRELQSEFEILRAANAHLRERASAAETNRFRPMVVPVIQLANQGRSTPEATVQTFFWAHREGNFRAAWECIHPNRSRTPLENSADFPLHDANLQKAFAEAFTPEGSTIEIVIRQEVRPGIVRFGIHLRKDPDSVFNRRMAITAHLVNGEWKLDTDVHYGW